jgi:hypothetical protein
MSKDALRHFLSSIAENYYDNYDLYTAMLLLYLNGQSLASNGTTSTLPASEQ